MAKIKSVDQAVVIESTLTNEQLEKASKYFPEALELTKKNDDGKTVPYFVVNYGDAKGDIGKYGVSFPKGPKAEKASVTVQIAKLEKSKRVTFIKDEYGKVLININAVEKQYADAEKKFDTEYKALENDIVVE
jgi:hypothetical protein